mgnify:CR=1 FL=1
MSCNAAHNTKVKEKIAKEYGNGDNKKKKVVVTTTSAVKKENTPIAEPKPAKPVKPLLEKDDSETLIATSKVNVSKNTVEGLANLETIKRILKDKDITLPIFEGIYESLSLNKVSDKLKTAIFHD